MAASLKLSLGANFAGRFYAGIVALVATPLYLEWLGVEAYGLVGFYLLLQTVTGFFGAGLTNAANREVAAHGSSDPARQSAKLTGFGRMAWCTGIVLGLLTAAASGWLSRHWLTTDQLDPATLRSALRLIAPLLALQVPLDFYVGALLGQRRPVAANLVLTGTATVRFAAAVLALRMWPPTIEAFFWSQVIASLTLVLGWEACLRPMGRWWAGAMPWASLRESLVFSAGMTGVTFTSMILSQTDRVVLSRVLRLEDFALYSLATTLANLLYYLIIPLQATYYPELTRLASSGQTELLARLYHQACQRMAVLVMSAGAVMLWFARDLLALWTSRPDFAARAAPVVMFLVGARMIGGLNTTPYALQFAHGRTSLVLRCNVLAIVVFIPILGLLALRFGAVGAAGGYFLLSLPFLAVVVWRTHRSLLVGEAARWWWRDSLPSLALALVTAGVLKWAAPAGLARTGQALWLVLASALTLGLVAAVNPATRAELTACWRGRPGAA